MNDFTKIATNSEIPEGGKLYVELDERLVVIFRAGGDLYCLDDVCTHDGGPLGEGQLSGYEIACPRHGAKFDMRTGQALTMPATEATAVHEIKAEGDDVLVRLSQ
ncbi:MAG: non-heme iron oxygenase ferredoxin subunit [Pirellulaceae bacterium]|nr:non-heme iron oxygenase ferredoxin subunit [Pirellulaceae bacterium]